MGLDTWETLRSEALNLGRVFLNIGPKELAVFSLNYNLKNTALGQVSLSLKHGHREGWDI